MQYDFHRESPLVVGQDYHQQDLADVEPSLMLNLMSSQGWSRCHPKSHEAFLRL